MITIRQARQELYEVFAQNKAGKPQSWLKGKVTRIFDHEPFGGQLVKPASITVCTGGLDADNIILELRIYVDASVDAKKSADLLDEIIETIEFTNEAGGMYFSQIPAQYSISEWETNFEDELKAWTAIARLNRARLDF
jgi:hypothetical protein